MIVEVRGVGTHNKGAELMLQVVLEQLKVAKPDIEFAVERWFGPYKDRARYGLHTVLPVASGRRSRIVTGLMSKSFRKAYGLVNQADIDAVIDASGFAFGDQWGIRNVQDLSKRARRWKRCGIPTVFLPQAWGPFSSPAIKNYAKIAVENIDLVFARDKTSFEHLRGLGIATDHVPQSHDFTNLIDGVAPEELNLPLRFACIVPNIRMLDKASNSQSKSYIDFLARSIHILKERGVTPVYLFHDRKNDEIVARLVQEILQYEVDSFYFECPRILKGILGKAELVVGSRFHALVGALSQAVPVVATSWSHKYEELLSEYNVPELLLEPMDHSRLDLVLERLADQSERIGMTERLREKAMEFKQQSKTMFARALSTLNLAAPN